MTFRQLEIFLAVADTGHVTRAAEGLHLSQSAASMAISQLERLLDVRLFERSGRRLILTERGRLLLEEARELLARVGGLPAVLAGSGAAMRGDLRIAASQTIGRYHLASPLTAFAQSHPRVHPYCRITNTAGAIDLLLSHAADLALVEGRPAKDGLLVAPWNVDRLEIVVAPATARSLEKVQSPTSLRALTWILRELGSGTRELFETAVHRAGMDVLQPVLTLDDTEAIKQAVIAGPFAACLPDAAIEQELRAGTLRVLQAPFLSLERQLWRVTRRGTTTAPVVAEFERWLEEGPWVVP